MELFNDKKKLTLSISCVVYDTDPNDFNLTILSLCVSCDLARENDLCERIDLFLIDNSENQKNTKFLHHLRITYQSHFEIINIISGHGNVGYGRGHNLALLNVQTSYHLVLNPDVILAPDNISLALSYMDNNFNVGLLAPDAFYQNGQRQYIAKRNPTFSVLLARAINKHWFNKLLSKQLALYEYRDRLPAVEAFDIEFASGCYMFLRNECVKQVYGFDEAFFMYFEDFDLSRRLKKITRIVHNPLVIITHYGGGASNKGFAHLRYFFMSYVKFLIRRI